MTTVIRALGPSRLASSRRKWSDDSHLWFWSFVSSFVFRLLIPISWSVWLSFYDVRNIFIPKHFRWSLELHVDAERRVVTLYSLVIFVAFAVFIVPTTFAISLALAVLINSVWMAKAFFRPVFFLLIACNDVIAAMTWWESFSLVTPVSAWSTSCSTGSKCRSPRGSWWRTHHDTGWLSPRPNCGCRMNLSCCFSLRRCSGSLLTATRVLRSAVQQIGSPSAYDHLFITAAHLNDCADVVTGQRSLGIQRVVQHPQPHSRVTCRTSPVAACL